MHVIVVGAGPGGLASALNLAGLGYEVTVLEKDHVVGGRMKGLTFGEQNEYQIDTGPTILQLPQLLDTLFTRAGLKLSDFVKLQKVSPNTRIHFWDNTRLDTSSDLGFMLEECARFDAQSRAMGVKLSSQSSANSLKKWLDESGPKYEIAYEKFIAHPAGSVDYYNPMRLLPTLKYRPWESLHAQLMRYFHDERWAYALSYPSKYLGLHPTTCSSVFSVISYIEMLFGVWHVMGGFRSLAQSMRQAAETLGVRFSMNTPVAQLWIDDSGPTPKTKGVILQDGSRLAADAVVINADLAAAAQKMIPNRYRRLGRISDLALKNAQYSCSTFMLYLGLDRVYDKLPHHLIYLSDAVRRTDRDALEDRVLDQSDPPFYACNPTVTDRSGAPDGHSTMYMLIPTPHTGRNVSWKEIEQTLPHRALNWLEKVGLTDIRSHVRAQRICSAPMWRDDFAVHLGAVFNLSHTWLQLGPTRPSVKSRDIDGLFWVGGGTHPGSGLLTIFESANIVGDYLSRAKGMGPLKQWPNIATQPFSPL